MGHHFSKSTVANTKAVANSTVDAAAVVSSSAQKRSQKRISSSKSHSADRTSQISNSSASAAAISIPPLVGSTINLQIEESPNKNRNGTNVSRHGISNAISANSSQSGSLNSVNNCARQIIIKIQLAKMENGNGNGELPVETLECLGQSAAASSDLNANTFEAIEQQILNVTLNANELGAATGSGRGQRTAGSSSIEAPQMFTDTSTAAPASFMNNNSLNGSAIVANLATSSMAMLKLNTESDDDDVDEVLLRARSGGAVNENDSSAVVEYCEVLEQPSVGEMWLKRTQESLSTSSSSSSSLAAHVCTEVNTSNSCCRNKAKSLSGSTSSAAAVANSKRRCCKCKCRDAIRGLSSAAIKVLKQKEPKESSERKAPHSRTVSEHRRSTPPVLPNSPSMRVQQQLQQQQRQRNSIAQMPSSSGHAPLAAVASTSSAAAAAQNNASNRVSIWTPGGSNVGDVIIRISTPQFMIEQCANAGPVVTVGRISETHHGSAAMRLMATAEGVVSPAQSSNASSSIVGGDPATLSSNPHQMGAAAGVVRCNQSRVPIVHSQIDFVHFLVPDLERITNSSFYWGKMDRYEAERLLDGMPEGTFLLRDSAQEEFLFSVTFRKYERSLHARIEQSGHKFSFDSHDPCVFTAPTVTGLLEHYKDPSCVMFFEPMLTVPLHRKNPFSLQKLCRATIVSNTTYDGVNQLELPTRLKSYLKEYHYKQKLRVKPFDEPFYSCT